jgi:hypothetical protein
MAACTLFRYGGRRRERDLLLFAAISKTEARERILEILERCVFFFHPQPSTSREQEPPAVGLCLPDRFHVHSPHCCCATESHSGSQTGPVRACPCEPAARHRQAQRQQKPSQYLRIHLRRDARPTFSVRGARSVRQNSYASYTRRRVHSFQLQGSASAPLAPIAAAKPDSDFSLRIEVARPTSSSSQRVRGRQSPAQSYPLNIQRPSLSQHYLDNMLIAGNREKGYAPAEQEDEGPPGCPGGIGNQNTFSIR